VRVRRVVCWYGFLWLFVLFECVCDLAGGVGVVGCGY